MGIQGNASFRDDLDSFFQAASPTCCDDAAAIPQGSRSCKSERQFSTRSGGLPAQLNSAKTRAAESENSTPGWVCSTAQMKEENRSGGGIKLLRRNGVYLQLSKHSAVEDSAPHPAPPHPCQGSKGTGHGSNRYYILSRALNLKGFATVARRSEVGVSGQALTGDGGAENRPGTGGPGRPLCSVP